MIILVGTSINTCRIGMDGHSRRNGQTLLEEWTDALGAMDGYARCSGQTALEEWGNTLQWMDKNTQWIAGLWPYERKQLTLIATCTVPSSSLRKRLMSSWEWINMHIFLKSSVKFALLFMLLDLKWQNKHIAELHLLQMMLLSYLPVFYRKDWSWLIAFMWHADVVVYNALPTFCVT